ncbi:MAG: Mrp/NBP35 family ATP-binding protein [Alphaproteobacteria bacterium]|nr:Mrp/NBP35 family ATP-binding protein [Alphaproteobacteria bacterium]
MNIEKIYEVLEDIIPQDKISGLEIDTKGHVIFSILVDPAQGTAMEDLRQRAEKAVLSIQGVTKTSIILTAEKSASHSQPAANDPHGMTKNPKLKLHIKKIIAVASGKGGVGKSTVAVNLAAAMAKQGKRVGLLDADIYGPSVPRLTGLPYQKPEMSAQRQLIPFEAHGVKVMSIGFMVDPDTPMIWRGPMVQSAIYQMLRDVDWGSEVEPLDVLVIDMPPGTGDAQLTIAQKIDVDGVIIVSTPQDLALIDAIKAIEMFRKTNVPILGLVENMSTYICTNCGHEEHIFGHGLQEECKKRSVSYLGEIPLNKTIRENSDLGKLNEQKYFENIIKKIDI